MISALIQSIIDTAQWINACNSEEKRETDLPALVDWIREVRVAVVVDAERLPQAAIRPSEVRNNRSDTSAGRLDLDQNSPTSPECPSLSPSRRLSTSYNGSFQVLEDGSNHHLLELVVWSQDLVAHSVAVDDVADLWQSIRNEANQSQSIWNRNASKNDVGWLFCARFQIS